MENFLSIFSIFAKKILNYIYYTCNLKIPFYYALITLLFVLIDNYYRSIYIVSFLISLIAFYIITYLLYFISPILLKILASFNIIMLASMNYFANFLNYPLEPDFIWILLLQASSKEVFMMLNTSFVIFIITVIVILILLWRIKDKKPHKFSFKGYIYIILAIVITLKAYFFFASFINARKSLPFAMLPEDRALIGLLDRLKNPQRENFISSMSYKQKPINIVLYIGESLRADHLAINGYNRNTNPYLAKLPIINFGMAQSCANLTYLSWRYLLNKSLCKESAFNLHQVTIPYYFNKAGFKTAMVGQSNEDSLLSVMTDVQEAKSIYDYENDTFKAYKAINMDNFYNNLLILNTYGSHFTYQTSTPKTQLFKPMCSVKGYENLKTCKLYEIVNSYDNTILYWDYTLAPILKDFEKKKIPSILLYTSDHGEHLNEKNNYYGHGTHVIEDFIVPLFIYTNKAFQKTYPQEYKALIDNSIKYKNQLNHEVVWHSIMHIGGFSNKLGENIIDYTRSVFSRKLNPQLQKNWYVVDYKRN